MKLLHRELTILFRKPSGASTLADRIGELTRYSEIKRMVYKLLTLQKQQRFRSLAVLSAYAGEGKTLLTAALAAAYAESCRAKVLVVDATTRRNVNSLALRDGIERANPLVDFVSLTELRRRSDVQEEPSAREVIMRSMLMERELVTDTTVLVPSDSNDELLIQERTRDEEGLYRLILVDTAALTSQNRGNVDPYVVAHTVDASILVASRELLDASNVNACTKLLTDPALKLIGLVSNEEFQP